MSEETPPNLDAEFYSELLRAYFDSANDGIFVLCDEMKFLTCNKKIQSWLGVSEDQLTLHKQRIPITELLGNNHTTELFNIYFPRALLGKNVSFEARLHPENGEERWVEINMTRVNIENGDMVIAIARDISERKKDLATIKYKTYYDELTDLPNWKFLNQELATISSAKTNTSKQTSLITIDLDRFKEINETLGQDIGDHILQEIATRLSRITDLTTKELLIRLVGDKFALLLPDIKLNKARAIAETMKSIVAKPVDINNNNISLSCSVGIASYPEHTSDITNLINLAEAAMHSAKTYKLGIAVYDKNHFHTSSEHLHMISDLRKAIHNKQITTLYQPIINLRNPENIRVEALARWNHKTFGYISPETFIILAEETDLINSLTSQIMQQAISESAELIHSNNIDNLSINLSPHCLGNQYLGQEIKNLLILYKIDAEKITLEMTESAIMSDISIALNNINILNDIGIKMAVDDFGTGHSSLYKLKQLPLSELKIDRLFISDIATNKDDLAITTATIQMSHSLGLEVVAEGIESREVFEIVKKLDCDYAQGFWISKPLPINKLTSWLDMFDLSMLEFRK
ncbi:MAG: bifunctional diguanylate cyclase/phosphodiesterase [Gammaproteobacteria bacterium]|nr:bifunctional diguanylate cyclase/phosphodiesterase [Gammaproteobacteria bacterium]MCW9056294.1 bifunctional diguanylate cyclase/phosphodiesterase [Gammaproteobacteria bacterium]